MNPNIFPTFWCRIQKIRNKSTILLRPLCDQISTFPRMASVNVRQHRFNIRPHATGISNVPPQLLSHQFPDEETARCNEPHISLIIEVVSRPE